MTASLLGRVPRELRLQIYEQLFPDRPIPAHPTNQPGSLRHDGSRTSVAILLVNRATYSEALPVLYSRVPFHVHVSRAGVRMCCGRMPLAAAAAAPSAADATPLRHVRRLHVSMSVLLTPWPHALDATATHAALLVDCLRAAAPVPLASLHLHVEWANGGTNFPVTYPTPALARRLLLPFARLRSAAVSFGRVASPRWDFGAADAGRLEDAAELLKEELRAAIVDGVHRGNA
ncbi:hypothetical protein SLS56_007219 [Neofusicoccum ribis]|uniref:Uncharacterized protein n=1 Tax=Neofusicoccum ribis TaxID=45134 RepID=A0ABR3SQ76_9PEZI